MDRGADALATTHNGWTTLINACQIGAGLRLVRQLLAAGVPVDARGEFQRTALHYAGKSASIEIMRELVFEHNANMYAVDQDGNTPFDYSSDCIIEDFLVERNSEKLTQEHGRLALHAVLAAAEFSFDEAYFFHPPQNPFRIRLPLGMLTLQHFRLLLHSLDAESIRNRDRLESCPFTWLARQTLRSRSFPSSPRWTQRHFK